MSDLVERLRARAESEREIQRNNEAVADALQGQINAFERRDGTHNNFAVRLGLEHRNCAKKDASLAQDWDEAADALEAAQARIEEVRRALAERSTLDVAETALFAWNLQAEPTNEWSTLSADKQEGIKAVVAFTIGRTRSAIRALTEAKEDLT